MSSSIRKMFTRPIRWANWPYRSSNSHSSFALILDRSCQVSVSYCSSHPDSLALYLAYNTSPLFDETQQKAIIFLFSSRLQERAF
jgi:hypothetical protein